MKYEKITAVALACGLSVGALPVSAQTAEETLNVIGTWGVQRTFQDFERPTFETVLPEVSGGAVRGEVQAMTDVGLNGTEVMRLLSNGIYDAGFVVFTYIAQGDAIYEGMDMPMSFSTAEEARALLAGFSEVAYPAMQEQYGVTVLANYSFPFTTIACREEFTSLADIEGRTVRVYSTGLSDMIEGLGGTPITIPFSEVIPALQRGVVDCATVGALPMYNAQWYDVIDYIYEVPVNAGTAFLAINTERFEAMSEDAQAALREAAARFEEQAWTGVVDQTAQGYACVSGNGECPFGDPASVTIVPEADGDAELRRQVLVETVLPRWAERCGEECSDQWYALSGSAVGLTQ